MFCLELFGVMTVMPNQAATDPESHLEEWYRAPS
jgi:hypothetical protein